MPFNFFLSPCYVFILCSFLHSVLCTQEDNNVFTGFMAHRLPRNDMQRIIHEIPQSHMKSDLNDKILDLKLELMITLGRLIGRNEFVLLMGIM